MCKTGQFLGFLGFVFGFLFCFSNIYLPHSYFLYVYIYKRIHLTFLSTWQYAVDTGNLIYTTGHTHQARQGEARLYSWVEATLIHLSTYVRQLAFFWDISFCVAFVLLLTWFPKRLWGVRISFLSVLCCCCLAVPGRLSLNQPLCRLNDKQILSLEEHSLPWFWALEVLRGAGRQFLG